MANSSVHELVRVSRQSLAAAPADFSKHVRSLIGRTFGSLLVVSFAGLDEHSHALWNCRCSCGAEKVLRGTNMVHSGTRSCGHVQRAVAAQVCGRLARGKFGAAHPMFGRKASVETRAKLSAAHAKVFDEVEAKRLHALGWSVRRIARTLQVGRSTMHNFFKREGVSRGRKSKEHDEA